MGGEELFLLSGALNHIGPIDPIYIGDAEFHDRGRAAIEHGPVSTNGFPNLRAMNESDSDLFERFLTSFAMNVAASGMGEEGSRIGTYSKSSSTYSEEIVVVGERPEEEEESDTLPFWHMGNDLGPNDNPLDDYGDGGGGAPPPNSPEIRHEEDAPCSDSAAEQIGQTIEENSSESGNEYGAIIVENPNGTFGAHNDGIHTDYNPNYVNLGSMTDYSSAQGIVHNHPWNSDVNASVSNHEQRYPSDDDWASLERMVNPPSGVTGADPDNLSIYIIDPWGVMREFQYSDREMYQNMTASERNRGENLPGETQGCGSS